MNWPWMRRWPIVLVVWATLLLILSGCGGSARATSWTGLIIVEGIVYAADLQQVVALDAEDAELVWAFPVNPKEENQGVFQITPAVDDERVMVASQLMTSGFLSRPKHVVWALERENGHLLWHFDGAEGQYVEGGAIGGDVFVIGNSDGNVYALDLESGQLVWTFETGHRVWATPLIVSDTVYIGSMDRHLYALNLADGKARWDFPAEGAFAGTPALRNGTLYIGAFDDRFYAIDADTGTERWHFSGDNWFWGSPSIYGDVVYATDVSGKAYALNADTGAEIWQQTFDAPVRAGPALSEDGSQVFVGSEDGTLYALDTTDGFVMWSQQADGQALSLPAVNNNAVYEPIIFGPSRLWVLHAETGREVWTYPQQETEE